MASNVSNNTMYEYLGWRGDLTLFTDPFNEVDNLILAQLAYVDFDGIVPENREAKIAIGDVCRLYWEMHTEEEIKKRQSFVRMSPFLLKPVAESRRFRKMKLTGYENFISPMAQAQLSATQFELEDGTIYVAFRGTDETLVGWKEDFNLSFMPQTEGQRLAAEYMKIHFRDTNLRLRVGGHSKGGNFAIYASAFSGEEVEKQIMQVYSNDGPGFREEVTASAEYQRVLAKTISIIPGDSVIGRLLSSDLKPIVVKSSARGIMQHDAMSWQIKGNRFVRTEQTEESEFVEKVMVDWLSKMDDESRMVVVDQIFNVFQSTGAFTLKDVRTTNLRELSDAVVYARSLPKEDRNEILQAFTELVRSGERTLYEQLENAGNSIPGFIRKWAAKRGEEIEQKMIAEEAAKEEKLLAEQAAAGESIAPEQRAPEQKASEQKMPEQNAPEQNIPEQKMPEQKTPEQDAPEQKA